LLAHNAVTQKPGIFVQLDIFCAWIFQCNKILGITRRKAHIYYKITVLEYKPTQLHISTNNFHGNLAVAPVLLSRSY